MLGKLQDPGVGQVTSFKVIEKWHDSIDHNTTFYWSAVVFIALYMLYYFPVIWRWIISWPTDRLAVLAYRCQHNTAPRYLTAQLQQASNVGYRQRLRSSSSAMLDVPRTEHATIGGSAFSSTAARVWNSLPTAVQFSESLDIFRRRLKTEQFARYNWNRACQTTLLLRDSLTLSLQLFAVATTLKSIDHNVAMTFILNN